MKRDVIPTWIALYGCKLPELWVIVGTLTLYSWFHFKSNVLEHRSKRTEIVPLSKYLWTALYTFYFTVTENLIGE